MLNPGIDPIKMYRRLEAEVACLISSRMAKKVSRQKRTIMKDKQVPVPLKLFRDMNTQNSNIITVKTQTKTKSTHSFTYTF